VDVCDALIVGGGPAGSSCGRVLVQAGMDVRILDREVFPRSKVCAGWITPHVLRTLGIDARDYASGRTLQSITGFRTGLTHGSQADTETSYGVPVSYGILRAEFDTYLLNRSGARIQSGTPVRSIERQDGAWLVNHNIRAPVLIGAGGHFCPVARYLNPARPGTLPVVLAQETEFRMDERQKRSCRVSGEMPELYFCQDLKGYGWVFRKGDHLNVGLGREDSRDLAGHVAAFHRAMVERRQIPAEPPVPYKGHAYHLQRHAARHILDDGILLVGDAAGLAYTESGEGIRPAVESGIMAAETIRDANGDYRPDRLQIYQHKLTDRFGIIHRGAGSWLPESLRQYVGRRLLSNSWFARHVVLDRWFLRRPPAS